MPHASTILHDRAWGSDNAGSAASLENRGFGRDDDDVERQHLFSGLDDSSADDYSTTNAGAPQPVAIPHKARNAVPNSTVELCSSPAALFLSAFSPPVDLPLEDFPTVEDKEGDVVGGYVLGKVIGYGATSVIRRASNASGEGSVAVKIVRTGPCDRNRKVWRDLKREEEIWSSLSHEHVLPLFSSYQTPGAFYFVTLLCDAGSLFDVLERERIHHQEDCTTGGLRGLPPSEVSPLFRQVISGLRYLHEQAGLIHRDMKLENVLVDEMGNCRIADFGMAKRVDDEEEDESDDEDTLDQASVHRTISVSVSSPRMPSHAAYARTLPRHRSTTTAMHPRSSSVSQGSPKPPARFQPGSLPYAAPELLSTLTRPVGFAQDIWAVGVMLYALVIGQLPFVDGYEPRLGIKIRHADIVYPDALPSGTVRVLKGCLDRNVNSRWTVAKLDDEAWAVGGEIDRAPSTDLDEAGVVEELVHETSHNSAKDGRERRSTSRARRSASRGPLAVAMGYSYSHPPTGANTPTSAQHRVPRHTLTISHCPPFTALSHSQSPPSSSSFSPVRGRERTKPDAYSRSASPSVLPTTPVDAEIDLDVGIGKEVTAALERGRRRKPRASLDGLEMQLQEGLQEGLEGRVKLAGFS